ncbi:acyl-CoA dehydrogenase family protein [Streptomyces fragilis]|uniref:Acyl-CoA dehydrogenase family protein n=1 Tax=Streptomyces fragilis TaxID=67301 RepID=A0ABV2YQR3_9ACTN|nr:acyl-CoA dehydrogenase family protein [Streptomyces fragilis]
MALRVQLTDQQSAAREEYEAFAREHVAPKAGAWDRDEELPEDFFTTIGAAGYLGAAVPATYGGGSLDAICFGLLNEEIGRACSSVRSLLTVHGMASRAVARWGSAAQREHWLPRLATGAAIGAFALTEPGAGSDVKGLATEARRTADGFVLDGAKRWITFGRRADVYLLFARLDGRETAFLVERTSPGLQVTPVPGILGTRASMLAELELRACQVPAEALLGRPGFGLSAVAADALELGRYSVAWGCVGLSQACLDSSLDYAGEREQFGVPLRDHQLVQRMLADMATGTSAARLLCQQAGWLRDAADPQAVHATWLAKYYSSTTAFRSATDAVQVHGAHGCGAEYPVQRYLRDAKVMEIIEGSTELQQTTIAHTAYHSRRAAAFRPAADRRATGPAERTMTV